MVAGWHEHTNGRASSARFWLDVIVASARAPADELERVRSIVRASLHEELTLADVARRVGRSARSIQRGLAHAGTSFRSETTRLRIERARELPELGELKVEAVARAVGIRSASSFVAAFRALTGTTPTVYRRATASHEPRRPADARVGRASVPER
jgi:transcriptional regulator GlxA family with amidase domain